MINEDLTNKGIAIDNKKGVEFVPITVELVEHVNEKDVRKAIAHERIGDVFLYIITGLCFAAIGALIGGLTLIL